MLAWPVRVRVRVGLFLSNGANEILSFLNLGVGARIADRLEALGIVKPMPVQAATIPDALAGRDVCGQAPTGSGKTLAFGIPIVTASTGATPKLPRALVLVPTRELAEQVRSDLAGLMGTGANRVVAVYGGTSYSPQCRALRRGVDIVVACPGRLEDLVARGDVSLREVQIVVLDEADRMVDMGFVKPVCRLVDQTANGRQVLLFSATLGNEVDAISRRYQHNPIRYQVVAEPSHTGDVTHHFWRAARAERVKITTELINQHGQAFVFCRTKRSADRVARQLQAAGVEAAPIHGDRSQPQRTRALAAFASRRTHALVGTDVVARGIHVEDIPCVVHFDLAGDADSYVHRSGRTGRVGGTGTVVSLVPDELRSDVRALQRALGFPDEVTIPFATSRDLRESREGHEARGRRRSPSLGGANTPAEDRGAAAQMLSDSRVSGTVKFFDSRRGYGFVAAADGSEVFVHHSKVDGQGTGRRTLRKGQLVAFELAVGRRGQEAHNVMVMRQVAS